MPSKYFSANDTVVPGQFMMFPKELLTDKYHHISLDAKVLYTLLLDRVSLSIKNNMIDVENHVYIVCKQTEIQTLFGFAKQKVQKMFKELEDNELIERKKQGCNLPDLIFVMNIIEKVNNTHVDNYVDSVDKTTNGESVPTRKDEIHYSEGMKNIHHGGVKISPVIYTNTNHTETNNTKPSIYQSEQPKDNELPHDNEQLMDRLFAEQFVKSNVDYDAIVSNCTDANDKFVVDTIVSVMTEIYSQKNGQAKVNGYPVSYSSLRDKFMDINSLHIEYVLECINKREDSAEPIRNWRAYLITALYNADASMEVYYDNLVRFDRYKATKTQQPKDTGRDLSFLVV
jgi:hypothetical protein